MKRISVVIATRNRGKVEEIRGLLHGYDVEIKTLDDFNPIPEVIENGKSFESNALLKASFTAKALGLPAIADDSGLVVDALNGAPGVYSARYAGDKATDAENNLKLLKELKGVENRDARFETVVAIAMPKGDTLTYTGKVEGVILEAPDGNMGFGYDPLFYYPRFSKTFAQMTNEEKNKISHRGMAFRKLTKDFDRIMVWIKEGR
ncbi:MAG: XTP/dITP diphosphatase [Deltaproteobacteria bacterium]|nr:XTP/dITP diphosphatase [Deltaproteobacteria bacterium]